jgi:hypothetical protein
VILLVVPSDDQPVVCPRCGERFNPEEEEIVDPEDE